MLKLTKFNLLHDFYDILNDCCVFRDTVQIETDERKIEQAMKYSIIKKPQFLPSLYLV